MSNITKKRNRFKQMAVGFLKDESGQSLTEYVLLVFALVEAVKAVGGSMKERLQGLVDIVFTKAESEL